MKHRPILIIAITITIIVEIILMILVYNRIGAERLPIQAVRLFFQLIIIAFIINKSNTGLFILTAYHIIAGLIILYSSSSSELFAKVLIGYHIIIGLLIYFHDLIENMISKYKA